MPAVTLSALQAHRPAQQQGCYLLTVLYWREQGWAAPAVLQPTQQCRAVPRILVQACAPAVSAALPHRLRTSCQNILTRLNAEVCLRDPRTVPGLCKLAQGMFRCVFGRWQCIACLFTLTGF